MGEDVVDRSVVILPMKEDEEVFIRSVNEKDRHAIRFREFISQYGLEYDGYLSDAGYTLACYLSSIGYVVLQNDDDSVLYLPECLSINQYVWFKNHKKQFRKMGKNLAIVDFDQGRISHYDEYSLYVMLLFVQFRNLLEEKQIVDYSRKKKE